MQNITLAERIFQLVLEKDSKYAETTHWHKIFVRPAELNAAVDWLIDNGFKRGDKNSRHEWLHPLSNLILIRDAKLATMFKLMWA